MTDELSDELFCFRHLVRLPKLTPEGYRVLMYTVKDTDYTKLVFSDAVKGFCMFNDCVLSEDGLMEGYIVCFDMKGISLGHLARVSLPALRSFMIYIQVNIFSVQKRTKECVCSRKRIQRVSKQSTS